MTSSAAERRFTFLEYLELEKRSEQHHEFVDGYVYAISGGSPGWQVGYEEPAFFRRLSNATQGAA